MLGIGCKEKHRLWPYKQSQGISNGSLMVSLGVLCPCSSITVRTAAYSRHCLTLLLYNPLPG